MKSTRIWTHCLVICLLLSAAPSAHSIDLYDKTPGVQLDITESLFLAYHSLLDDANIEPRPEHIVDLRNRLNLALRLDPKATIDGWKISPMVIGGRIDAAWFPNAPSERYADDIRPEELYFRGSVRHKTGGRIKWTLGDDYLSFGRGMALSLRKMDELGFDLSLRGGHLTYQHKYATLRMSGGVTNVVNVDGIERKRVPDPNDLIFAARLETRPLSWMLFGAHVVDVERRHSEVYQTFAPAILDGGDYRSLNARNYLRSLVVGGNMEFKNLGKAVTIYAEANAVFNEDEIAAVSEPIKDDGYAVYAAVTAYAGPVTLLAEAKHYENYRLQSTPHPDTVPFPGLQQQFQYITPPTLERYDQRVQQNTDVPGGHLRADIRIPETRDTIFLSGAYFVDTPVEEESTLHVYGGWEHKEESGTRWVAQYGYRYEGDAGPGDVRLRMFHLDLDLYLKLSGPHDLQLHLAHEFRQESVGTVQEDSYMEGTSYISWNFAPHWSVTAQFEYKTSDLEPHPYFPGAYIAYKFTHDTHIRLFGGRMKGGLKCAGGVCRIFPNFEGVQLDATMRF